MKGKYLVLGKINFSYFLDRRYVRYNSAIRYCKRMNERFKSIKYVVLEVVYDEET